MEPITRKERILSGEDIEPITRLEHFLKEAAGGGGGGGGGSSLPSYSSADIGKVFTVGKEMKTVVVVPEQTVTTDENGNATITGVDFSELSDGQTVVLYAGKTPVNATYDAEAGGLTFNGAVVVSQSAFTYMPNTTVTVKALSEVPVTSMSYVVPEQTVTTEYDSNSGKYAANVQIDDISLPSADYTYTMTINGTDYPVVINGWLYWTSDHEYAIGTNMPDTTSWAFVASNAEAAGTYTISLTRSVPSVEPKWEAVGLPDYSNAEEGATLKIVHGVPTWTTT